MTPTIPNKPESESPDVQVLDMAFLGSLLPGIIHNWATPLSGVIGATQLLERRVSVIDEMLRDFDRLTETERHELRRQLNRNRTNVEILSRNAMHLADLLQTLVYRITRGNGTARDRFPLNELVQNELRFLEANLQFKHKVRRTLSLKPVIPATSFSYGLVAALIDELVTRAIASCDAAQGNLEMKFATESDGGHAVFRTEARNAACDASIFEEPPIEAIIDRLRDDGWEVIFTCDAYSFCFELRRPEKTELA